MADAQNDSLKELKALKSCLEELESHAENNGAMLAANLIGAASNALGDEIFEREAKWRTNVIGFGLRYDA